MRAETSELLKSIENVRLFAQVGSEPEGDFTRVTNWKDAIATARTRHSEKARTGWINTLSGFLASNHEDRSQTWNSVVKEIKAGVESSVAHHIEHITSYPVKERAFIVSIVNWDIVAWCLEREFSDLTPPWWYSVSVRSSALSRCARVESGSAVINVVSRRDTTLMPRRGRRRASASSPRLRA